MAEPYLGEIRIFGFNFAPLNFAFCDGQLLPISQYSALFSILGTTYGGDGIVNFALPNFQGRAPMHWGNGIGLTPRTIGEVLGSPNVTLTVNEIPAHNHIVTAAVQSSADESVNTPTNQTWLGSSDPGFSYSDTAVLPNTYFAAQAIGVTGGSQPHDNMQPYLVMNFCIAVNGIPPSRN